MNYKTVPLLIIAIIVVIMTISWFVNAPTYSLIMGGPLGENSEVVEVFRSLDDCYKVADALVAENIFQSGVCKEAAWTEYDDNHFSNDEGMQLAIVPVAQGDK